MTKSASLGSAVSLGHFHNTQPMPECASSPGSSIDELEHYSPSHGRAGKQRETCASLDLGSHPVIWRDGGSQAVTIRDFQCGVCVSGSAKKCLFCSKNVFVYMFTSGCT
ncbi:hypothetical protein K456DRAFT_44704 [Colletotrichum gloeosporioides 23]|nr:hypothetical protein K456DRAFT_44704 [Colletotrichum gloeosporioides 23]